MLTGWRLSTSNSSRREDLCLDAAAALEARLGVITPIDPALS
jgi:hypothetical protein